jgi:hypothetical protein
VVVLLKNTKSRAKSLQQLLSQVIHLIILVDMMFTVNMVIMVEIKHQFDGVNYG